MSISNPHKSSMPYDKYRRYQAVDLPDRTWPANSINQAPTWCSVDLRDGNQALIEPMNVSEKLKMFNLLVAMGFKEIEVGFPAASQPDYDFLRLLIEQNLIPDDVVVQVLCQAREHLIYKTFESLAGCSQFIFHLYNSTSPQQRRIVFNMDKNGVTEIARKGVELVKKLADECPSQVYLQYSPESFTLTETDFALQICEAVAEVWQPTPENPIIFNLPSTVEVTSPNKYADQIEWFIRHLKHPESCVVSLHTHNDRGTGIAASELGLLAGATRIEGTLFGNGERTGNADIITLAMNLYSQGIDPALEIGNISEILQVASECNKLPVHERHPYAGRLVFTAFSGSHQDAIRKGMKLRRDAQEYLWDVPYLPIDPTDLGASYEETVRVNSQSGKGGVGFIIESNYGIVLPAELLKEFSQTVQLISEQDGGEITAKEIWAAFFEQYVNAPGPYQLGSFQLRNNADGNEFIDASLLIKEQKTEITGIGNGGIDAFITALNQRLGLHVSVAEYQEYALGEGADAQAICMIALTHEQLDSPVWGVGVDTSTTKSALSAVICSLNRMTQLTDGDCLETAAAVNSNA